MRMAQPLLDEVGIQHVNVTSRIRHSEIVWGKVVLEERERFGELLHQYTHVDVNTRTLWPGGELVGVWS